MNLRYFLGAAAVLGTAFIPVLAAQSQPAQQQPAQQQPATAKANNRSTATVHTYQQHQDDGQRLFEAHCSRCHTAPEGFSPNISGTIVRHMRVRAGLSRHEEEELLRFFNP